MFGFGLAQVWRVQSFFQLIAIAAFSLLSIGLAAAFVWALAGDGPRLSVTLTRAGGEPLDAGLWIHGLALAGAVLLLAYMPANWRVLRLETAHRDFNIRMEDVARAYFAAHAADREGVFTLPSEYDAVRERMAHLADHPDLGNLEPAILELAARMSRVSEDLAHRYSNEAIERARTFLAEREGEASRLQGRIETALAASREIRRWHDRVALEEDIAQSRLDQLINELNELLPEMGLGPVTRKKGKRSEIISLRSRQSPSVVAD
ncbi:MAG: DNA repair protein [Paracoccaceae bacterium]|nr:DNA repair protein [Paracoccaceae bacterium]